jgi:DNA-binding transcriptional LysR family regulator
LQDAAAARAHESHFWYNRGVLVCQVEALVAVAARGSVSAAAAELGVAQSTVTRRVRALEREVGRDLLGRRPGERAHLTAAGDAYAEKAPAILAAVARLKLSRA